MVDEVTDLVDKLSFEINKYEQALISLREDIANIQCGNNSSPYWNGKLACGWVKSALAHLDHNTVLYNNIIDCLDYLKENKL